MKSISLILLAVLFTSSAVFAQEGSDQKAEATKTEVVTEDVKAGESDQETTKESTEAVEFGEVTGTQKYKITCTSATDVREIAVITQEDSSVGVVYKKFDTLKTMALAKNDPAYADQVAEKIKSNLETAGFSCTKE